MFHITCLRQQDSDHPYLVEMHFPNVRCLKKTKAYEHMLYAYTIVHNKQYQRAMRNMR